MINTKLSLEANRPLTVVKNSQYSLFNQQNVTPLKLSIFSSLNRRKPSNLSNPLANLTQKHQHPWNVHKGAERTG